MKKDSYSMSTKIRIFIDFDWREWVLPMGAAVLAELWLASREKRWPGLLLPGAAFLWGTGETILFFAGAWGRFMTKGVLLGAAIQYFGLHQIPALLLLAVYAACRECRRRKRRRMKDQVDQMNIDDL